MSRSAVRSIVEKAAKEAYDAVDNASSFQDHGHNKFRNEFCRRIDPELKSIGVGFQRDPNIGSDLKPDVFIPGHFAVEIKHKGSGLSTDDIRQAEKYCEQTKCTTLLINFGKQNGPNIREINP